MSFTGPLLVREVRGYLPSPLPPPSATVLIRAEETALQPESKSYPFPVWSGLLSRKHRGQMGTAIWMFLWLLDRVTKERDGWGIVLGGKPIKDKEIAQFFGLHVNSVRSERTILLDGGYIEARRTPYGISYRVRNSRKFGIWGKKRSTGNSHSLNQRPTEICEGEPQKTVETKKTMQLDHAVKPTPASDDGFDSFWAAYPRKEAKLKASTAWRKLSVGDRHFAIVDVERRKLSPQWLKDGGAYVPHPATFLSGRRWQDHEEAAFKEANARPK